MTYELDGIASGRSSEELYRGQDFSQAEGAGTGSHAGLKSEVVVER